ncbi:F17F8.5 [Cucumis melo var. makuwa]|uniref:F17F8.5 n=1 Tax=Cucumis melo var. makuwa TaxID=1194695 RepID=A0A5A7VHU9_CUCMM|nr:F17F8.5 [Cucumis melo var. makuwa]TYK20852.1 F17F8.5 [Cucumis melo var. makuwa]
MSRGPWHLGGKPMLLRKWTPGIVLESFVFTSVPICIKLGRIPMELRTEAGLAVVASAVGKPLTLDLATKERHRLSYARVCIKLDVGSPKPVEITVSLRGVDFIVSANYEWKPQKWDGLDSETRGEVVLEAFNQTVGGSYSNSGVGRIWVMWKKNHFSFSTRVVDEQFVTGTLTDLLSGVCEEGEMEDFDLAIRDADLVEPSVQVNWFTWTSKQNSRVVSFRFFNHWLEDPSFIEVVARMWGRHEGVSPLVSLMRNLQRLKPTLRRHFVAKQAWLLRPSGQQLDWRKPLFVRNPELDVDSDGSRISSHDGVVHLVVNYFRNSLGSQKIGYRELSPVIEDIVQFRWSEECCQALQIPTIREEVRRVLFSMDSGKAPVPDGFSVGFIKGAWSVVGEDFCDAVLHFFETCYLPIGVNATAITLIPKRRGAERMEEFRPISCCNVIYKCISKILTDRLHVWLPSFISSNQSAFIPGRSIIDNILLCQELVGGYHLNSGKPRYTLKIDLQKAYDSVNWDFLFGLLIAIGTPLKFVSWIRACVTSSMFSIMINGSFEGFFHGRKGVRQGDPLSPFLFVMVMEVLSRMLNKIPQSFQFHRRCEKVKLNHLTFADDLMIFCAADEPSLSFIREYLQKFGELSGLFVNLRKSSIFVAEVSNEAASHLAASMGFVFGNLPVRYLGLPLLIGRLRSNDCAPLIQRMTSRIRSWTAQVLSFVGRLQLVRSVLRSLQVYWPSVFVLPAYVHNEVDKILRSYLWRGKEEGRGGIKVAWVEVCLPFEEGGLAIRDGPSWNIASTLKILWLLLTSSGSL